MNSSVSACAPAVPLATVRMLRSNLLCRAACSMPARRSRLAGSVLVCSMMSTGLLRSGPYRLATDTVVVEPLARELRRVVLVATVDHQRRPHQALQGAEVRSAEGLPFGHQAQRIGIDGRLVLPFNN